MSLKTVCRIAFSEQVSGGSFCLILLILGPIWAQFESFGDTWGHPELKKFEKISNCAHRGGQEDALEAPSVDFGAHLDRFLT